MREQATAASQPAWPAPTTTMSNCSVNCTQPLFYGKISRRRIDWGRIIIGINSMAASSAPAIVGEPSRSHLGWAWLLMWIALAIHVADEALTGFLAIYNPTVTALRERFGFWPMPTFGFRHWLTDLGLGILLLALLSPFAFRNARWIRPLLYFVAIVAGILNALGHTLGTILGHTVNAVRFARPAPGFYSSPLLLAVSIYALVQLRRTRPGPSVLR